MATVHVTLSAQQDRAATGATAPVLPAEPRAKKRVTVTSANTPVTDMVALEGEIWGIVAIDGAVEAAFSTGTPNAVTDPDQVVLSGERLEYGADAGQQLALKTL